MCFYAALDADTSGVEGSTYVWSDDEIVSALKGVRNAEIFKQAYGLNGAANFEKKAAHSSVRKVARGPSAN